MTRRSLISGTIILIIWAATMTVLLRRSYINHTDLQQTTTGSFFGSVKVASKWQPIEEYMLIIHLDPQSSKRTVVGAASTIINDAEPGTSATYTARFRLEGKLSPILPKATIAAAAQLDKNVNLTSFHGEASLGPFNVSATGESLDSILYLKTINNSQISYLKKKLTQPVSMAEAIRPSLSRRMEIEPGSKMSTQVVDPLTGKNRGTLTIEIKQRETIQVDNKEIQAYKVISSIGDIQTIMWVDEDGKTIRRNLVGNLIMERTTKEIAIQQAPSLNQEITIPDLDLAQFTSIPLQGQNPTPQDQTSTQFNLLNTLLR